MCGQTGELNCKHIVYNLFTAQVFAERIMNSGNSQYNSVVIVLFSRLPSKMMKFDICIQTTIIPTRGLWSSGSCRRALLQVVTGVSKESIVLSLPPKCW
jgi:mevalonate kinase